MTNEWGYREGSSLLSSKYQIYISYIDSSSGFIYGKTQSYFPDISDTYIVINNQLSTYPDSDILATTAHEYHHASENSYDSIFALLSKKWVYEGSAAWMENEVTLKYFPTNYDAWFLGVMNEYMNTPYKDIADERSNNGYPSGQYWYFLADNTKINFNGTDMQRIVNRKVWEELSSYTWSDVNGAIDAALADAPSYYNSFDKSFKPFTRANYFKGSWYPNEINYIDDVYTISIDLNTAPHEVTKNSSVDADVHPIDHYGAEYFKITAPYSANVNITFGAEDSGANFYVRVYPGGIENNEIQVPLSDGIGSIITKATNIVVVVERLNDGGLFGTPSGNFTINTKISNYSRKLTINGTSAGAQTNYQMKFTVYNSSGTDTLGNVYLGGSARSDFGDLRFTKSDGVTLLDYWIESYTSGVSAVVWAEIDSIPASPGTADIYLYYGNPSATCASSGVATFDSTIYII